MKTKGQQAYEAWMISRGSSHNWSYLSTGERIAWEKAGEAAGKAYVQSLWKPISQRPEPLKRNRNYLMHGPPGEHENSQFSKWDERFPDRTHWMDPRDLPRPEAPRLTPEEEAFQRFSRDPGLKDAFMAGVRHARGQ